MIYPKITFLAGLILAVGICGALIFFSLSPERNLFSDISDRDVFHRLLREYDASLTSLRRPAEPAALNRRLDKLEKNAQGVETWLSVLKRRRNLALQNSRFLDQYHDAARKAAASFPYSEPLAAVAAEALLRIRPDLPGIEAAATLALKNYGSLMNESRFAPLALGIRILLGDMESPGIADSSQMEPILAAGLSSIRNNLPEDEGDRLTTNLGILRLLGQNISGAALQVQAISTGTRSPALLRFSAEYYYDFGDPLRAAELFSRFNDETSIGRSADALWLGGEAASARNIWKMLASTQEVSSRDGPSQDAPSEDTSAIRLRSLYNLAATATDQKEEAAWLERLFVEGRNNPSLQSDPCFYAGIIRYTRLLDTDRALAILEDEELQKQPLLDLEQLRRRRDFLPADRIVAETWFLLGRHPEEAALYQWGAYFFDQQRKYDESALLLKTAERNQISGPWLDLNAAIRLIEDDRLDEAEELLRAIPRSTKIWQVYANLARLLEVRQAPTAALEYYKTAAALVTNPESASRIQIRIALCLQALGRPEESRQALEYSLNLNPDNLKARMELKKMSYD